MRILQLLLLWTLWSTCILLAPESVFWRDSGEFMVQAFSLDIAHPAGFPLYGMLGNLFTLLPFGPLPWRIILLSCAALVLLFPVSVLLLRELVTPSLKLSRTGEAVAGLLILTLSLSILPLIIKQIFSAEVYLINGVLLILIAALVLRGLRLNDLRLILTATFLGGLSVGNHVSALLSGGLIAIIILAHSPLVRRNLVPLILVFLTGLSIYAYLPARALATPPMNTGYPVTIARFLDVLSDARDRHLRAPSADTGAASLAGFDQLIGNPLHNLSHDLGVLNLPSIPGALLVLLAAAISICIRLGAPAFVPLAVLFGNYLFFSGWDGDPWVPAITVAVILVTAALLSLTATLPDRGRLSAPVLGALLLGALLLTLPVESTLAELRYFRSYETPARSTERWLRSSPAPVVITENSWFLARYLSDIEGIADDKEILYQPSVLFPAYFTPVQLSFPDGEQYDSEEERLSRALQSTDPAFPALGRLVELVTASAPLMIEPGFLANTALHPIITLNSQGSAEIRRRVTAPETPISIAPLLSRLSPLTEEAQTAPAIVRDDVRNYFENLLNNVVDLLKKQNQDQAAIELIERLCLPVDSGRCSLVSLNSLGLLYIHSGSSDKAIAFYHLLLAHAPGSARMLEENLRFAERSSSGREAQP